MSRRPSAGLRPLLVALAVAAPTATALAVGGDTPTPGAPSTTPSRIVGEQVATAREIVPFGAGTDDGRTLTWAVGQTRGSAPEPPSTPTTPRLPRPTTPEVPDLEQTTPDAEPAPPTQEPPGEEGTRESAAARLQDAPAPMSAPVSVLLEGTTRGADAATAWARAAAPLDAAGAPLEPGSWRPAGARAATASEGVGTASPHAGESTAGGAAALLVTVDAAGGGEATTALLARTTGQTFRALPEPAAELLAPAAHLSAPGADIEAVAPFAAVDAPTSPETPTAPYGRTGVLIAPPGGDGVLVWDGTSWSEEPFLSAAGTPVTPPRSVSALASTADGDGVALITDENGDSADRVALYRRTPGGAGWRRVTLDSGLLGGALPLGDVPDGERPGNVVAVRPIDRPGDPLTVAPGHWWVDVAATTRTAPDQLQVVAATVHLTPGPKPAAGGVTTPPPTGTDPTTTGPAPTDPASTDPTTPATTDPSTPAATDPTTPQATDPTSPTPPTDPFVARGTGTWCQSISLSGPAVAALPKQLCDGELPGKFAVGRGYRSIAFAGQGLLADGTAPATPLAATPRGTTPPAAVFGGRIITSPVVGTAETQAREESTASGGYLRLDGDRFTLRGGMGEPATGDGHTEAAAFISDRLGWTGGKRVIGHVTTASDPDAATYPSVTPSPRDTAVDIAVSPSGMEPGDAGAVALLPRTLQRFYADGGPADQSEVVYGAPDGASHTPRAIAWPLPDVVVIAGTNGLLTTVKPPVKGLPSFEDGDLSIAESDAVAKGLDLTDVAFSDTFAATGMLEGWAVGRAGAALHLDVDANADTLRPTKAELPAPLDRADLRAVAYAGETAYVASSAGLLVGVDLGTGEVPEPTLTRDEQLQPLLDADQRTGGVYTVAALPDGTVVVDGRYVLPRPGQPWERLPSPVEGDVVALAISRPGAATAGGAAPLRIQAAVADAPRPRVGELYDRQEVEGSDETSESSVLARDGRIAELTPDGWIDRARTPLDFATSRDLAVPDVPTQAIASRPSGSGFAVASVGGAPFEEIAYVSTRSSVTPIDQPRPNAPTALPSARAGRDASGPSALPAPTTAIAPAVPGAAPIRILIGGHPACFDSCVGRADQRVAPTENLRQALATAARMREAGGNDAPRAVIIGGGRSSGEFSVPFDRAAAADYVDLLRGQPGAPPVFPAIGTGDATTEDNRNAFARLVADPLRPTSDDGVVPVTDPPPPKGADGATVAYAFDVPGAEGGAARIVVIDNVGSGMLRGDPGGEEEQWLDAVLRDAERRSFPTVVVGAARLDRAAISSPLVAFLAERHVAAYVSTDGDDNPAELTYGPRERRAVVRDAGHELLILHTSALGHMLPAPTLSRRSDDIEDDDFVEGPLAEITNGAGVLELSIPPERESLRQVVPRSVPVFRNFLPPTTNEFTVGRANIVLVPTTSDHDNGMLYVDEAAPDGMPQATWGAGISDATPWTCRLFQREDECGSQIDAVGRFSVADPSIAVFARARQPRRGQSGLPTILTDEQGNPIADGASPVLCPLKPGSTTATATVAGRSVTMPIRVAERPANEQAGEKKCEFVIRQVGEPVSKNAEDPTPVPAGPTVPAPGVSTPAPGPAPEPRPGPAPSPQPPPSPTPADPLVAVPLLAAQPPGPTIVPSPKPITNTPTPSPPTGVSTQQVPSHSYGQVASPVAQVQVATAMQQQRREQLARESIDHHAVIYEHAPRHDVALALLGGGALALVIGAAGHVAGRRRALARAASRRWAS